MAAPTAVPDVRPPEYRLHAYLALARLAAALDTDPSGPEAGVPARVGGDPREVPREEVRRAIRSNSRRTDRLVDRLVADGLATRAPGPADGPVRITAAGIELLRTYRVFYRELSARERAGRDAPAPAARATR